MRRWATPAGGGGAGFGVGVPEGLPEACHRAPPAGGRPRLERHSVLIIEDNADTRDVLKLMLEVDGATVETAEGGEAGLHAGERMRPDVVLCDIGLPHLDGFEVARPIPAPARLAPTRLISLPAYAPAA